MALLRVRHPGCPPKDQDLGPAHGELLPWLAMRKTIDDLPRTWLGGVRRDTGGHPRIEARPR